MKLIDILVEELTKRGGWPRGAAFVAQEEGGGLWSFTSKPQKDCDDEWMDESSCGYHKKVGELPEASDHDTSTITREQYEAALAAKNEGWIEWGGGECPVDGDALVEVKYRNGTVKPAEPARFYIWTNGYGSCSTTDADIIAYRLHQTQKAAQAKADEADMNECIGQTSAPVWNGEGLPPVGCMCERSWAGDEWRPCKILFASNQIVVVKLKKSSMEDAYNIGDVTFRPIRSEAERKLEEAVAALVDFKIGYHCHPKAAESYLREVTALYDAIAAGKIPGVKLED